MNLSCFECGSGAIEIAEFTRRKVFNTKTQEFEAQPALRQYCNACCKWGDYVRNENGTVKKVAGGSTGVSEILPVL